MVHLPHIWGLGHFRKYGYFPYEKLKLAIDEAYGLVDTEFVFGEKFDQYQNGDFYLWFHYSELGNEIVAESIFEHIAENNLGGFLNNLLSPSSIILSIYH